MDKRVNNVHLVTEVNIKEVKVIVDEMLNAKRPTPPSSDFEKRISRLMTLVQQHGAIVFVLQIFFATCYYYWGNNASLIAMGIFGIFSMLSGLTLLILGIIAPIPFLLQVGKSPTKHFMSLVNDAVNFDLTYAYRLSLCNMQALRYFQVQFKLERDALEKRGAMLSGTIDKTGLFPAIAGAAILYGNLVTNFFSNPWLQIFPPIILGFHLLNLWIASQLSKKDRVIALIEYVISMEE